MRDSERVVVLVDESVPLAVFVLVGLGVCVGLSELVVVPVSEDTALLPMDGVSVPVAVAAAPLLINTVLVGEIVDELLGVTPGESDVVDDDVIVGLMVALNDVEGVPLAVPPIENVLLGVVVIVEEGLVVLDTLPVFVPDGEAVGVSVLKLLPVDVVVDVTEEDAPRVTDAVGVLVPDGVLEGDVVPVDVRDSVDVVVGDIVELKLVLSEMDTDKLLDGVAVPVPL